MFFHNEPVENVLKELGTDRHTGLTVAQVTAALKQHGENCLKERRKKNNFERFIEQFKDVMILILIVAAIVSFVIACIEGNPRDFFEPALILLIAVLNAIMGVVQERKAEKAPNAKVLRDSVETIIDASQLVPGDIIHLEAGDFVPADARLIKSVSLKSEESALTGKSVPAKKDADQTTDTNAPLGDRSNMVFSGCSITYGTATAVVTATGMHTEMGKIANLLDNEAETQTPLQKKLSQLGKSLGAVALVTCIIIFVAGLSNGIPVLEIFMTTVSLAVSAIPEGLPAIVTITDALRERRGIYVNIKKAVGFLLSTNIGEVVAVFTAMLLWHKSPFLSMQLLWINLVIDSLPAIALGMEPVENNIMEQKSKSTEEGLFAHGFRIQIVLQGLMFAVLTLFAFRIGIGTTGELAVGQTLAFMVLSLSQIVQAFNMRSGRSLLAIGIFSNHKLNWAALCSILLVCLVLFTPLSAILGLVRLSTPHYIIGLAFIVLPILIMELAKVFGITRHQV